MCITYRHTRLLEILNHQNNVQQYAVNNRILGCIVFQSRMAGYSTIVALSLNYIMAAVNLKSTKHNAYFFWNTILKDTNKIGQ